MLPPLDQLVDVLHRPAEASCQGDRKAALASRHESDEINLVDCHLALRSTPLVALAQRLKRREKPWI